MTQSEDLPIVQDPIKKKRLSVRKNQRKNKKNLLTRNIHIRVVPIIKISMRLIECC